MKPNRACLASFVLALVATVAVGCGSSGSSAGGELTADLFKTKADAICLASKTERGGFVKPASAADAVDYLSKGLANTDAETAKLAELRPPTAQQADWDATLGLLKDRNALIKATVDKIKGGADAEKTITEDSVAINAANEKARTQTASFGFAVCGKSDA